MADTGWLAAGTIANMAGVGSVAWANTSNAQADDAAEASANIDWNQISNYLRLSNFSAGIPAGATIDGFEVMYERRGAATVYAFEDYEIKLVDASGTVGGANRATTGVWASSSETKTVGGATDKWGLTLTEADVNDTDFGVAFAIYRTAATVPAPVQGFIDYVFVKVYYTTGPATYNETVSESVTAGDSYDSVVDGVSPFDITLRSPTGFNILLQDATGATYNDSFSESVTVADDVASAQTFANGVSESVTLTDSQSSIATFGSSLSESVTVTDSTASAHTMGDTLTESVTVVDSVSGGLETSNTVSEAVTPSDSISSAATFGSVVSESITAGDSLANTATFASTVSESVAPTDSTAAANTMGASLSESVTVTDNVASGSVYADSVSEAVTVTDSLSGAHTMGGSLTESVTVSDSLGNSATFSSSVTESATLVDAQTAAQIAESGITETLAVDDAFAGATTVNATLTESVTVADNLDSELIQDADTYNDSIEESVTLTDAFDSELITATQQSQKNSAGGRHFRLTPKERFDLLKKKIEAQPEILELPQEPKKKRKREVIRAEAVEPQDYITPEEIEALNERAVLKLLRERIIAEREIIRQYDDEAIALLLLAA